MNIIRPGIGTIIKCYLSLMNEFDNEEVVKAFDKIMKLFSQEIKPYALEICNVLKNQFLRQIDSTDFSVLMTAIASFTDIRRILHTIQDDKVLLL